MNIYEAQMFVDLIAAVRNYVDGFNDDTIQAIEKIARERHCGNGYWSMDGLLDDLTDLTGNYEVASEILNNI